MEYQQCSVICSYAGSYELKGRDGSAVIHIGRQTKNDPVTVELTKDA